MSRRKIPTCMADVKKSRGALTGAVKKALGKIEHIKHDEVAAVAVINATEVERLIKSVTRTEQNFQTNLDEAQEYSPEGEEDDTFQQEEEEAEEKFEDSIATFREIAERILALKNAQLGLADLTLDITSLQELLSDRPNDDHTKKHDHLSTKLDTLRDEWKRSKAKLPLDHALKKELDACIKVVDSLGADTTQAKTRSTSGSATHPSSSRVERDRTKLPAIAIPTFTGDILTWPTFWQKFSASIADHDDLPESTKLAYLRSAIKDPEATILLNPAIDGPETYKRLVKELLQRYARTKKIHRGLVDKLSTLPSAKYANKELRRLLDSASSYVDCLKSTGQFTLDAVITSMVYTKLPYKLQVEWDNDRDVDDDKVAPYQELFEYVNKKILTLSDNQPPSSHNESYKERAPAQQERGGRKQEQQSKPKKQVYSVAPTSQPQQQYKWECSLCQPERHPLYICPKWTTYSVTQRMAHIKAKSLCTNCLGVGHAVGTCRSRHRCSSCDQAHHSTIHQDAESAQQVTSTLSQSQQLPDALLQTAKVLLKGPGGQEVRARALIDSAAGLSLITHRVAKILDLPLHPSKTALTTLQDSKGLGSEHLTEVTISPIHRQLDIPCRPAVLKSVISSTPTRPFAPVEKFPHLWGLQLADPTYHIPGAVDILLGSDVWLKLQGKLPPITDNKSPVGAVSTIFGWVVTGTAPVPDEQHRIPVCHVQPTISNEELHQLAYNFWLSEDAEETAPPQQSEVDDQVEQQHTEHVSQPVATQPTPYNLSQDITCKPSASEATLQPVDSTATISQPVATQPTPYNLSQDITCKPSASEATLQPAEATAALSKFHSNLEEVQATFESSSTTKRTSDIKKLASTFSALKKIWHTAQDPLISDPLQTEFESCQSALGTLRYNILEQDPAALQPTLTTISTRRILSEVILPQTPSAECQTPQQISLPLAATRSQPPAILTPTHHILSEVTRPENPSAECQTPQQIRLPQATAPFLQNIIKKHSGENASSVLQSIRFNLHHVPSLLEKLDTVYLTRLLVDEQHHPIYNRSSINNLLLIHSVSSNPATLHYWIDASIYSSWLLDQKRQVSVTNHSISLMQASKPVARNTRPTTSLQKQPSEHELLEKQSSNILDYLPPESSISDPSTNHDSTSPVQPANRSIGTLIIGRICVSLPMSTDVLLQLISNTSNYLHQPFDQPRANFILASPGSHNDSIIYAARRPTVYAAIHLPVSPTTGKPATTTATEFYSNFLLLSARRLSRLVYFYQHWGILPHLHHQADGAFISYLTDFTASDTALHGFSIWTDLRQQSKIRTANDISYTYHLPFFKLLILLLHISAGILSLYFVETNTNQAMPTSSASPGRMFGQETTHPTSSQTSISDPG